MLGSCQQSWNVPLDVCAGHAEQPVHNMHNAATAQRNAHESAVHLAMCLVQTLQALADAFRVNNSVTKINLRGNKFGDEGLKAWGPWLGGAMKRSREIAEFSCRVL